MSRAGMRHSSTNCSWQNWFISPEHRHWYNQSKVVLLACNIARLIIVWLKRRWPANCLTWPPSTEYTPRLASCSLISNNKQGQAMHIRRIVESSQITETDALLNQSYLMDDPWRVAQPFPAAHARASTIYGRHTIPHGCRRQVLCHFLSSYHHSLHLLLISFTGDFANSTHAPQYLCILLQHT